MKDNVTPIGHDFIALSKPPTVPMKNSTILSSDISLLIIANLKAETTWKIEETIEATHNLSYTVERCSMGRLLPFCHWFTLLFLTRLTSAAYKGMVDEDNDKHLQMLFDALCIWMSSWWAVSRCDIVR